MPINDSVSPVNGQPGVTTENTTQANSPNALQPDSVQNLKGEMNRKFSKINEQLHKLVSYIEQTGRSPSLAGNADEVDDVNSPDWKRYIDRKDREKLVEQVKKGQKDSWREALKLFPELDESSDSFDKDFYSLADQLYTESFDINKDKDAPLKAVKLAAVELGKIEQLTKEKILKDEARRSRILAEGGTATRESRKEKPVQMNEAAVKRYLGIDPEKLAKRIKENKDRYGDR